MSLRPLALAIFGLMLPAIPSTTSAAVSPTLSLRCGLPDQRDIVQCRLSGRGFHPREQLHVSYLVIFTALPRRHGRFPQATYRRLATADAAGAFTRPPFGFAVVRYHESYRLTVTVVGSHGDRAATTAVGIAQ